MSVPSRLIALEIRASRFGFAVLEGSDKLLDWGVRFFGEEIENVESTVSDRIDTLLAFYDPVCVVLRDRDYASAAHGKRIRRIVSAIKRATGRSSARLYVLTTMEVRNHFAPDDGTTKYDIAKGLADRFEELSFKLPNPRKAYQSEAPAMLVFDALATGVAFLDGGGS
jgi:hypothetical protein